MSITVYPSRKVSYLLARRLVSQIRGEATSESVNREIMQTDDSNSGITSSLLGLEHMTRPFNVTIAGGLLAWETVLGRAWTHHSFPLEYVSSDVWLMQIHVGQPVAIILYRVI